MPTQVVILLLVTVSVNVIAAMKTKVITTKTGKVQGVIVESSLLKDGGKEKILAQKFLNIPYAEPPVGKLRFAKPKPKKPWTGVFTSTIETLACVQEPKPGLHLTEDCLILNIWTPYPKRTNTTVMVFIHGGAFVDGYSNFYLGHNFVAVGEVILVTINYRLSVLGFLSTGDERIKGNFGLFDQRLALKWVKENIVSFGGNPHSITIFGESAGGASVSAHTLSKQSWPYFDRAIIQSGSLTMPWATASKALEKQTFKAFIQGTDCKDDESLLECLQANISAADLQKFHTAKSFAFHGTWLAPDVDGDFLTSDPQALWEAGEVKPSDVILGITKDEMISNQLSLLYRSRNIVEFERKFEQDLKKHFKNYSSGVYNEALRLYKPKCILSFRDALKPIVEFESDKYFICAIRNEAKRRLQIFSASNVFLYQYSYSSPVPLLFLYPQGAFGFAGHALDLISTFGLPINNPQFPAEDKILAMRMILYWTNFAKTGDPNTGITKLPVVVENIDSLPKWPKYTTCERNYLDMESLSRMIVRSRLREKQCDFLDDPEGALAKRKKQPVNA